MTETLRKKLEDAHKEETTDITKYKEIFEMAKHEEEWKVAGIVDDILCDERSHACILENILTK